MGTTTDKGSQYAGCKTMQKWWSNGVECVSANKYCWPHSEIKAGQDTRWKMEAFLVEILPGTKMYFDGTTCGRSGTRL